MSMMRIKMMAACLALACAEAATAQSERFPMSTIVKDVVEVTANQANMRCEPSTRADLYYLYGEPFRGTKGEVYAVVGQQGGWYNIHLFLAHEAWISGQVARPYRAPALTDAVMNRKVHRTIDNSNCYDAVLYRATQPGMHDYVLWFERHTLSKNSYFDDKGEECQGSYFTLSMGQMRGNYVMLCYTANLGKEARMIRRSENGYRLTDDEDDASYHKIYYGPDVTDSDGWFDPRALTADDLYRLFTPEKTSVDFNLTLLTAADLPKVAREVGFKRPKPDPDPEDKEKKTKIVTPTTPEQKPEHKGFKLEPISEEKRRQLDGAQSSVVRTTTLPEPGDRAQQQGGTTTLPELGDRAQQQGGTAVRTPRPEHNDLATFDLFGPVRSCVKTDHDGQRTDTFSERGRWTLSDGFDVRAIYRQIERDRNNRLTYLASESMDMGDVGSEFHYTYDARGFLIKSTDEGGGELVIKYNRDQDGTVLSCEYESMEMGQSSPTRRVERYSRYARDAHGNWISRLATDGRKSWTETRAIEYYGGR